jgi:glycosyltransferase involved in cell wall biosynthesis
LRILILNWRCPKNPQAGGAELLTFEIARRLNLMGHEVEWFAASYAGAPQREELDGVRIVRAGRQWTVHWHAFMRYRATLSQRFDAVIDEVNTMPFFTPLWAEIPRVMLIFQLAREVWWFESRFPLNVIGYVSEPLYLRFYRRTPVLTISNSTEDDLRKLGFEAPVQVFPVGIDDAWPSAQVEKAVQPTFLYLGRLAPSKRVDDVVRAFAQFRQACGTGALWIAGTGDSRYSCRIKELARRVGVLDATTFWGRVSSAQKLTLMRSAHALLVSSVREGWGLVVTEASAVGTPAVVYDVPGLRDSVRNEETGLVVPPGPKHLARAMLRLLADTHLYTHLVSEGQRWSRTLTYDAAAEAVNSLLRDLRAA